MKVMIFSVGPSDNWFYNWWKRHTNEPSDVPPNTVHDEYGEYPADTSGSFPPEINLREDY